jgi:primase-polymerase (primpol)-like protein
MTDDKFLREFEEYRKLHSDFFPPETPIEKQHDFYRRIRDRETQRKNEQEMGEVNRDIETKEQERERIHKLAAVKALSDNPMEKFIAAYKVSHVGHYQILRAIIYAECLKSSGSTKGLQPAVTGSRGSGKSHAVKTSVHLLPKDAIYTATLSPKALYYKNPPRKTTFYMDDAVLPDELVSLMKRKQTQFQEMTTYGTVMDKKWAEISIGPRMVFITTSVAQLGDEQLSDRALLIDIKNEKTDDTLFYEFENDRRTKGLPEFPESEEVQLCRNMLAYIRDNEFRVILPSLDFDYYSDRRLIGMTYDLMEASAILNHKKRECQMDGTVIVVTATEEDLANALDFDMFKNSDAATMARLSKSERAFDTQVQTLLNGKDSDKFTEKELAEKTKMSVPGIRNYLYGRENGASTIKDGIGLCGKTTWYKVDTQKDMDTESVKNYVYVSKHTYTGNKSFAWVKVVV